MSDCLSALEVAMNLVTGIFIAALVLLLLYLVWLLLFADCDLTLALYSILGRPIASLAGQVVWITGASSGLGEQMAYDLAAVGASLVLSARSEDQLLEVKRKCLAQSTLKDRDVLVLPMDVRKTDKHKGLVQEVLDHFGKIDILVNNAAVSFPKLTINTSIQEFKELFETNVFGVVNLTQSVLSHFLERRKGHIVVISSLGGKYGYPLEGAYIASKHAIQGYFDCLSTEIVNKDIPITMVCPGYFHSHIFYKRNIDNSGNVVKTQHDRFQNYPKMPTSRCSYLTLVAVANKLREVWICYQPLLLNSLCYQYLPTIYRSIFVPIMYTEERVQQFEKGTWPKDIPAWKPLVMKQ